MMSERGQSTPLYSLQVLSRLRSMAYTGIMSGILAMPDLVSAKYILKGSIYLIQCLHIYVFHYRVQIKFDNEPYP